MKSAIGYIRVSSEEQAREGASLENQRSRIEAWASEADVELMSILKDAAVSGANMKSRHGLETALELACDHKAVLVVFSLSRLSRSTRDTLSISARLDRAGADLVSLSEQIDTTSAAGKMVFRMLAVLSEFERDQISERTSSILQYKKARREAYSPTPYGFSRKGKLLVIDEEEQRIVEKMVTVSGI